MSTLTSETLSLIALGFAIGVVVGIAGCCFMTLWLESRK